MVLLDFLYIYSIAQFSTFVKKLLFTNVNLWLHFRDNQNRALSDAILLIFLKVIFLYSQALHREQKALLQQQDR